MDQALKTQFLDNFPFTFLLNLFIIFPLVVCALMLDAARGR